MTREPSTLFAPDVLPGPDGIELLPMPADIRAIYDAAQRNTPFSKDVDDALAAHRNAHGEAEQIEHAQRVDPADAMPSERYRAYVSQRRYAVRACIQAGMARKDIARFLGVAVYTLQKDAQALGLRLPVCQRQPRSIAGHSVEEVLSLLHELGTRTRVAARIGVTQQAVSLFCKKYELDMPQNGKKAVVLARRKEVRRLSEAGLSVSEMAQQLAVPYACITADRKALKLPRVRLPAEKMTLLGLSRAEIEALLARFQTIKAVALHLGTSGAHVSSYMKRAGLKAPRDGRCRQATTPSTDRKPLKLPGMRKPAEKMTLSGLSRAEVEILLARFQTANAVALHLGVSASSISVYMKRAGLKAPRDGRRRQATPS